MVNSIHLNLLKQYYQSEKNTSLDNDIKVDVREDNILKYDYTIHPHIQNGILNIDYINDNTVQIKCNHLNQGKPETLFFKYDPSEPCQDRLSIKDVVDSIKTICKINNKRLRTDATDQDNEPKNDCDIYFNRIIKKRKICKDF